MMQITKAQEQDAHSLAQVSKLAFDGDIHYGAPAVGGPPGYTSANWHVGMMQSCDVYKIMAENGHFDRLSDHDGLSDRFDRLSDHDGLSGRIVGGIIVYAKGYQQMELGRMWVHPDFQNQGIGGQAIQFLEETYPDAKLWTLDTPKWNIRNHHFYQKMGYELTGEEGHGGVWFAKKMS